MKNVILFILGALLFSASLSAIPNPASVFCIENGGQLEIRTTDRGDEFGVCVFEKADGCCRHSECEEFDFLEGRCQEGQCSRVEPFYNRHGDFMLRCAR